jgi:hypothetical protein
MDFRDLVHHLNEFGRTGKTLSVLKSFFLFTFFISGSGPPGNLSMLARMLLGAVALGFEASSRLVGLAGHPFNILITPIGRVGENLRPKLTLAAFSALVTAVAAKDTASVM